jgi:ATP-dependent helicase/nuclease subunit B
VVTRDQDLQDSQLLPFKASFDHLVPAYLAWQTQREAQGWYWADGESEHSLAHPTVAGLQLKGRIDRLDHGPDGESQLLDYKTSALSELKNRVKEPLEDTQLVYYTLLLSGGQADPDLLASYLSLDSADGPVEVKHDEPATTATALLLAVGGEWQRLRQGAALPALGEGDVCKTCEARGLCRRDEWVAV